MNTEHMPGDRQVGILDTPLLSTTSLLQVGAGRGVTFTELLASAGVGSITVIDPDTVSRDNIGQSSHVLAEVGQPKAIVATARARAISPSIAVQAHSCKAEEVVDLETLIREVSLFKIGTDDPKVQFWLADLAQLLRTPAIACGTTGDNSQYYVALIAPDGPSLRELLPDAWRGLQEGYKQPPFFPSCRLNADSLNVQAARLALGLLHHLHGSTLPIASIGAAFASMPLVIGSNSWHEPSSFLTPTVFLTGAPE